MDLRALHLGTVYFGELVVGQLVFVLLGVVFVDLDVGLFGLRIFLLHFIESIYLANGGQDLCVAPTEYAGKPSRDYVIHLLRFAKA
jgi:hypothetical protein